eukprot:4261728-Alexandrium_andersonii.AAC.1
MITIRFGGPFRGVGVKGARTVHKLPLPALRSSPGSPGGVERQSWQRRPAPTQAVLPRRPRVRGSISDEHGATGHGGAQAAGRREHREAVCNACGERLSEKPRQSSMAASPRPNPMGGPMLN